MQSLAISYDLRMHGNSVIECLNATQGKKKREIETNESFQEIEIGLHVIFPQNFLWIESFHMNFEGFEEGQSFVPNDYLIKIPKD